jgi:hypothetical protein
VSSRSAKLCGLRCNQLKWISNEDHELEFTNLVIGEAQAKTFNWKTHRAGHGTETLRGCV